MNLIVVTGMSASGKDSAGDYIVATRGAVKRTLSDILRKQLGPGASNTELREAGNKLRETHGAHILAQMAYEDLRASGAQLGVIVSVRHPQEARYLGGATFLWLDAPEELRHVRYKRNDRPALSYEKFLAEEALQYFGDGTGYSLKKIKESIPEENRIMNDFPDVAQFHAHLDSILTARGFPRNSY